MMLSSTTAHFVPLHGRHWCASTASARARCSSTATNWWVSANAGTVVVRYDGALSSAGGTRVQTRRFEASVPADGTAATVGPALNAAANAVAAEVARWIGG